MYSKITSVILILMFAAIVISAQESAKVSDGKKSKDETAIRANVEQMMKGWNAKSGAEFAKPFAEDADYVVVNGMQIKGREAIDKGHQGIFDAIYKNSSLALSVEQLRFLRRDVAIVHVRAALTVTMPENLSRTNDARITLVMTKNQNRWEIAAFQNTQIQPPPPTAARRR